MPKSTLQTERLPNGKRVLLSPLIRDTSPLGRIVVGEGMVTDFSSIPFWAAWIVRWSRVDVAGVLHDALYASGAFSRKASDDVWWQIARRGESRANALQAWVCWVGLRLGGWVAWRKHAKLRAAARG